MKQPFFLLGLEDLDNCKNNAFGAMWLFIMIFASSVIFILYDTATKTNFQDLDEGESVPILPRGMTDYRVNSEVELAGMDFNLREIS